MDNVVNEQCTCSFHQFNECLKEIETMCVVHGSGYTLVELCNV